MFTNNNYAIAIHLIQFRKENVRYNGSNSYIVYLNICCIRHFDGTQNFPCFIFNTKQHEDDNDLIMHSN